MMAPIPQIKVQIYTSKKLHEFQKDKCKETHVNITVNLLKAKDRESWNQQKSSKSSYTKYLQQNWQQNSYQQPWRPDDNMIF